MQHRSIAVRAHENSCSFQYLMGRFGMLRACLKRVIYGVAQSAPLLIYQPVNCGARLRRALYLTLFKQALRNITIPWMLISAHLLLGCSGSKPPKKRVKSPPIEAKVEDSSKDPSDESTILEDPLANLETGTESNAKKADNSSPDPLVGLPNPALPPASMIQKWTGLYQLTPQETAAVSSRYHIVRTNKLGQALVVWRKENAADHLRVIARLSEDGVSWGVDTRLDRNENTKIMGITAEIDDSGNALVAWTQVEATRTGVYYCFYDKSSNRWSDPQKIVSHGGHQITSAYDPTGGKFWLGFNAGYAPEMQIQVQGFLIGTRTFEDPIKISPPTDQTELTPVLAMNSIGQGAIAWRRYGTDYRTYIAFYDKGSWKEAREVSGPSTRSSVVVADADTLNALADFDLKVADSGQTLIVWEVPRKDFDLSDTKEQFIPQELWAKSYEVNSESSSMFQIHDGSQEASFPVIKFNSKNQALIAYRLTNQNFAKSIWSRLYDSGTNTYGQPQALTDSEGSTSWYPDILVQADHNFIVAFVQKVRFKEKDSAYGVRTTTFDSSSGTVRNFLVVSSDSFEEDASFPKIYMTKSGKPALIFRQLLTIQGQASHSLQGVFLQNEMALRSQGAH